MYWDKSFVFLLYFSYFNAISGYPTCNPNRKIQYGTLTDGESVCHEFQGCWDDTAKCYFSEDHIKGFSSFKGTSPDCTTFDQTLGNTDRFQCARECLKASTCNSFVYDSSSKQCQLSNKNCKSDGSLSSSTKITYNRFASKNLACVHEDCGGNDISFQTETVNVCQNSCALDSNCKMLTLVAFSSKCHRKNKYCDLKNPSGRSFLVITCVPGPIFPDWYSTQNGNRDEIIDNSNTTCKTVGQESNFNLKIPWPTVGREEKDFNLLIVGKNLQKCMNSLESIQQNTVLAFTVFEILDVPQFTGNFKACNLIFGDDNTFCKYRCSCGKDYCEAVHIRAFASDDVNMSICNYQIE